MNDLETKIAQKINKKDPAGTKPCRGLFVVMFTV